MYISFRAVNNIPVCNFIIDSSTAPPADKILAQYIWIVHRRWNIANKQTWEHNFPPKLPDSRKRNVLLPGPQASPAWPEETSVLLVASKEQWWNDVDMVTPKNLEKTLFLCHFIYYEHHTVWPGIEDGFFGETLVNNRRSHDYLILHAIRSDHSHMAHGIITKITNLRVLCLDKISLFVTFVGNTHINKLRGFKRGGAYTNGWNRNGRKLTSYKMTESLS